MLRESCLKDWKQMPLQEFALVCARASSYFHNEWYGMWDNAFDQKLNKFLLNKYHVSEIRIAKKRLAEVTEWNATQARKEVKRIFDNNVRLDKEHNEKIKELGVTYLAMHKLVEGWVPATKDHQNLKKFMLNELARCIETSGTLSIPRLSGKKYKDELIKGLRRDIAYHMKEHKQDMRNVRKRNEQMRALLKSLHDDR